MENSCDIWNSRDLPLPPIVTCKAINTDIDIKYLLNQCQGMVQFFDKNKYIQAEYLILSRIVYRMKTKFRSSKDFKCLEKLYKTLNLYFNIKISSVLKTFIELIPEKYTRETYLPNKNLLNYILVRFQGMSKLLERVVETCKISANLFDERIHSGHFWKLAFITFSLLSRMYILAKHTLYKICYFYSKLLPFSKKLMNTNYNFLPSDYHLPEDLMKWLNVDWIDLKDEAEILQEPSQVTDINELVDLINDNDDVLFCDEYVLVKDQEDLNVDTKKSEPADTPKKFAGMDEDVGEIIAIYDDDDEDNLINTSLKNTTEVIDESIELIQKLKEKNKIKRKKLKEKEKNAPIQGPIVKMNFKKDKKRHLNEIICKSGKQKSKKDKMRKLNLSSILTSKPDNTKLNNNVDLYTTVISKTKPTNGQNVKLNIHQTQISKLNKKKKTKDTSNSKAGKVKQKKRNKIIHI